MIVVHQSHEAESGWDRPLLSALDSSNTLVLAFGSRTALSCTQALRDLTEAFPSSVLIGCSGAGVVGSRVTDMGLSVAVAHFERSVLHHVATPLSCSADSRNAGVRLAKMLPPEGLKAVFLVASGIGVNGAKLVEGMVGALPEGVPVSGGLAGDDGRFQQTWVLNPDASTQACATAVGFYGEHVQVSHGCRGGWLDFGPERTITRASGNVLYELDGQPALALYKHYLGNLVSKLPGSALLFPLSLRSGRDHDQPLVRTILGIDEATQSMTFAGDMPVGTVARLMRTSVDRLVASAEDAAADALRPISVRPGQAASPVLAISVSCIGRRLMMGERTEEEVEAVADLLPPGSAHAGFYSYGEVAPAHGSTMAQLHNQTMTVTMFQEH